LAKGFEIRYSRIARELTTPTGAAIVTTLAGASGPPPSMVLDAVGYGLGRESGGDLPNALRLMLGRAEGSGLEEVVLLETNLDDLTGEATGYLLEKCLEEGALDAYAVPIQMKKSRPGMIFAALARVERMDRLLEVIHSESGSLGVRIQRIGRSVLPRETVRMETSLGPVRVKRAQVPGWPLSLSPEYEDVARIARERGMPIRLVQERIMAELHNAPE
jgi:uncharacterized protein (DUF111 family)